MNRYAIWDLDNCLADDSARIPLIDWSLSGELRWDAYHQKCEGDPINPRAMEAFAALHKPVSSIGAIVPVFFTGRPASVRAATIRWIQRTAIPNLYRGPLIVLMRTEGDSRRAVEVKRTMLEHFRATLLDKSDEIVAAHDDREDIVKMYQEAGIPAHIIRCHDLDGHRDTPEASMMAGDAAMLGGDWPDRRREVAAALQEVAARSIDLWPVQGARPPREMREVSGAIHELAKAQETFRERNSVYGDNWLRVAKLLRAIAPPGAGVDFFARPEAHVMTLILMKLSRYAASGLSHLDSARDAITYSAILADLTAKQPKKEPTQ